MNQFFSHCVLVIVMCSAMLFTLGNAWCADESEPSKAVLETETQKISYMFGMQLADYLKQNEIEIDPTAFMAAVDDVMKNRVPALTEQQAREVMMGLQEKKMKEMSAKNEKNLENAKAFLEKNSKEEGVITMESGLQYRVVKTGNGATPKADSKVKVHYRGTLLDGDQFDSSYDRGEPAVFQVNQVIPGWQEALQLMPVGSQYKLFIPPNLAYGEHGNQRIPGNSLLIFDVELLEIVE